MRGRDTGAGLYLIFVVLIIFCICMYCFMGVFGFSAFPDEFGYWAPAAHVLGYDWSSVTSLGSYYSYGYSLILTVILSLFSNSIHAYRAAIIVNAILQCLAVYLVYVIVMSTSEIKTKSTAMMISSIAVLYPAWSFYSQMTMTESLILFLFVFTMFLMLRFLEKPGIIRGILLAVTTVYLYFVHMRNIGTVAAVAFTLVLWAVRERKNRITKKVWAVICILLLLFLFSFVIKKGIINGIYRYAPQDQMKWNDYSGQIWKIIGLFSTSGIKSFFLELCGKLLYISLATYGLALWGIAGLFKCFRDAIHRIIAKEHSGKIYLELYIFLAVIGQILVANLYLIGSSGKDRDRLDLFLHGRYIDMILPLLIAYGMLAFIRSTRIWRRTAAYIIADILLTAVCSMVISRNDTHMRNAHGFTMLGMSYLLPDPCTDTVNYLWKELLLGIALTLIAAFLIACFKRYGQELFLIGLFVIQIMLGLQACNHYIFPGQSYIYGDIMMTDEVKEIISEHPDKKIVHIYTGETPYIEVVQFSYRQAQINVIDAQNTEADLSRLGSNDIVLVYMESSYNTALQEMYQHSQKIGHMILYDNG